MGNVLVRYDPHFIVTVAFPKHPDHASLVQAIFKHKTWYELNLGHITEHEAIQEYHSRLGLEIASLENMASIVRESLTLLPGSIELVKSLHPTHDLYALTDNTNEIMVYLRKRYDFWPLFKGVVVSANVGHLKPSPEIFQHLLKTYQLIPQETLFIDDMARNVQGAKEVGIEAIVFSNIEQCKDDLKTFINRI